MAAKTAILTFWPGKNALPKSKGFQTRGSGLFLLLGVEREEQRVSVGIENKLKWAARNWPPKLNSHLFAQKINAPPTSKGFQTRGSGLL